MHLRECAEGADASRFSPKGGYPSRTVGPHSRSCDALLTAASREKSDAWIWAARLLAHTRLAREGAHIYRWVALLSALVAECFLNVACSVFQRVGESKVCFSVESLTNALNIMLR